MQNLTKTQRAVVDEARRWLGTPYCHQASIIGHGCDCLGLIRGVWRALYGDEPEAMPNYTADWAEAKGEETLRDAADRSLTSVPSTEIMPADLLLFRWRRGLPAKHAAILTTETHFIHACEGVAVSEVALSNWWRRRIAYAFRFPAASED